MFSKKHTVKIARSLLNWVGQSITRISVAVLSTVGFITSIFSFIQLFLGNRKALIIFFIGLGAIIWLIILGRLAYIGFSKKEKKSGRRHSRVYKFNDHQLARQWLLILLSVTLLSLAGVVGFTRYKDQELRSKTIILLTNFQGPNPESYLVNEKLYKELKESLTKYSDVLIQTTSDSISETENSPIARKLGEQYRADLVLWGYYGVTSSNVLITIHFENMNSSSIPLAVSQTVELKGTVNQIDSFQIQQKLANQMTSLVYFITGITRYQVGQNDQATELFTLALNSTDWAEDVVSKAYVLDFRAGSYSQLGKYDLAISDLDTANKIHPEDPKILVHLGSLYRELGDLDSSLSKLKEALRIDPSFYNGYLEIGLTYQYLGQHNDAINNFNRAIQLDPNNPSGHLTLANYYHEINNDEKAIEEATNAINLDKNNSFLYGSRGALYINIGDNQHAIKDFSKAISLNPTEPSFFNNRGVAYGNLQEYKKECKDYSQALKLGQNNIYIHNGFGNCYLNQELYEKAIEEFTIAVWCQKK